MLQRLHRFPPLIFARAQRQGLPAAALAAVLVLVGLGPTPLAQAAEAARLNGQPAAYLAELQRRAGELALWEAPLWHRLLHYRPDLLGSGVTSEADGAGFFNAPDGKTNPRAELEATLAAFFNSTLPLPGGMTAQCTFPARFHWLNTRLAFDPARLPSQVCTRWNNWRDSLDPASISLVFASYYFNNPASMFGHTLLVFNKRGRPEAEWLLNYAVNYAAFIPPGTSAFSYGWNGLFGGFQGYFAIVPYYLKVREYNDMESRDLWEYRLNLTPQQVARVVRHAWEMGVTSFDYYFLKENCSYHLLSLLEVGNPELDLRSEFRAFTLPGDTVRAVLRQPTLVAQEIYRPSRGSQLLQKLALMGDPEKKLVLRLTEDPDAVGSKAFRALPPQREALVLEAAVDIYQARLVADLEKNAPLRADIRKLLLRRAQLGTRDTPVPNTPQSSPPNDGHRATELRVGVGTTPEQAGFAELQFQPAFHNLVAREAGYAKDSHLELGQLRMRYREADQATQLEKFTVLDIRSLPPLSLITRAFSWKGSVGWRRERLGGCADCVPLFLQGGVGYTVEGALVNREIFFAFLEGALDAHTDFEQDYRAGVGVRLGMVATVAGHWRFLLSGAATHFGLGEQALEQRVEFKNRFALSRNLDLGLEYLQLNDSREAQFSLGWFF